MDKSVIITSLDHECIEIKIRDPKKWNLEHLKDEVEHITNIMGPHQLYYLYGKEIHSLENFETSAEQALELVENNTIPVMRFLINLRSRVYPVYVSNFDKKYLLCLKLAIEKKLGCLGMDCPFDAQTLKLENREIPAKCRLSELPNNARIELELNSFIPQRPEITTYAIDEEESKPKEPRLVLVCQGSKIFTKIDERAAKWRQVCKGLTIHCYCRNRKCEARNRAVVANLGFGIFTLDTLNSKALCPICSEECQEFLSIGFYCATWKFKGVLKGSNVFGEEKTYNKYRVWREINDEWENLRFSVRPFMN